jgi:DNA-binding transcriptional regulator YdaS (Cro superfamily)
MKAHQPIIERVKTEFGGAVGLAAKLTERNPNKPITSQAISQWKQVPAERLIDVEAVTGLTREQLRPDLAAIFVRGDDGHRGDEGAAA